MGTMDAMWRDVRAAVRGLIRRPFFTLLAGVTLAVGIGANTAIFSVVDGVLINPLPFPESDRLVTYNFTAPGIGAPIVPHSESTYLFYLERTRALDAFAVLTQRDVNVIADGRPQRLNSLATTQAFNDVMATPPALGRGLAPGDDRDGAEPVVLLSHAFWQQTYGGDRDVLGETLEVDGVQRRIVGVMPEGFHVLGEEQLFFPISIDDTAPNAGNFGLIGVARMADRADVAAVNSEMNDLLRLYAESNPDDFPRDLLEQSGITADAKPFKDIFVQDIRQALWVLLGTVGFVLLIACANVANLFLVRADARQRELALRTAIGASRLDIVRHFLTESVTLALGGGLLGLALASFGVQALLKLAPVALPETLHIGIDGSVLAFTAAISLTSGLLFGLLPVLGYGRPDITGALKEGGRSSTAGRERHRARSALVVTQVALALVLLVGSGLMLRSFVAMRGVHPGFEDENRLTFRVGLAEAEYPEAASTARFYRDFQERLAAVSGVEAVGMASSLPLTDAQSRTVLEPDDAPFPEGQLGPLVEQVQITPGYFAAMEMLLIDGRDLEWTDAADGVRAVVISETLAELFWTASTAVGRRIKGMDDEAVPWEVVGVVGDVHFERVDKAPGPMIYWPIVMGDTAQLSGAGSMAVVVHTGGDPMAVLPAAREALAATDPRLPMIATRTLAGVVEESMASTSFTVVLLGIAAGIALILGTVGIYGVMSYIVSRRTQEIGVRIALGAPQSVVLRSIVGQGFRLTAVGIGVGLVGAFGLSRLLASLLYGVPATDPLTFGGMAIMLLAVASAAAWVPARRASRMDPVEALRSE